MMKYFLSLSFCFFILAACQPKTSEIARKTEPKTDQYFTKAELEIKKAMQAQEDAWNRFDIDGFMEGYWNDEELSFIGSRGLTKSWATTLANYKKGYPNPAVMGKLNFDILQLRPLGTEAFYMIGKYTLTREADTPSGYFTLVWEKKNDKWVITSDHTSG